MLCTAWMTRSSTCREGPVPGSRSCFARSCVSMKGPMQLWTSRECPSAPAQSFGGASPETAKRALQRQRGDSGKAVQSQEGDVGGRPSGPGLLSEGDAISRALRADEVPRSPIDLATQLIAESGVWHSSEQYLVTLYVLQFAQAL